MAYDHFRNPPNQYSRPFAPVGPIIDATTVGGALGQIADFMSRNASFTAGVANTQFFPFSAICRIVRTFPGSSKQFKATGFYISDTIIVTSGHVLWKNGAFPTSTTIEPGRNGSFSFPSFSASADDMEVHPSYQNGGDSAYDLGVIHVTTPPPGGEYFHLVNQSPAPDRPLAVAGYASGPGVNNDFQHLDIDRVRRLSRGGEAVDYNLQTLGGTSGAPAFLDFPNNRSGGYSAADLPVMGVHRGAAGSQHNQAVLLTPEKLDWVRGGGRMSVAQGLSRGFSTLQPGPGGLPLVARARSSLGGLPLMPARAVPPAPPMAAAGTGTGNGHAGMNGGGVTGPQAPAAARSWGARSLGRSWIVADPDRGMSVEKRTFGKSANDLSGKTTLKVIIRDMPEGGTVRWNIPDADDRTRVMFEVGGSARQSASGTQVTLLALSPGVARIDCMVKDASGTTIESNKYLVSSPKFVKVVFAPSVDAFLRSVNLGSRRAQIIGEMRAITSMLYENVNVRFVLPGDSMPAHLDLGPNAAYPGGRAVPQEVSIIEILGDRTPPDPGHGHIPGAPANFAASLFGINHSLGLLPAPFDTTNLINVMLAHFREMPEVAAVEDVINSSSQLPANLDQAATMYGRLLGETSAHEFGHMPDRTDVDHNRSATGTLVPDGLLAHGSMRSFAERTGMAAGSGGNLLTDNGSGGINRLNAATLHDFEEILPVNPPLDAAGFRIRGRAGSFGVRASETNTVHLPGATVLEGWQAELMITAVEETLALAMSGGNPALYLANQMLLDIDRVLDACDRYNITLGLGSAIGGGVAGGVSGGAGIVFAPGRRVGFYGALSGVAGAVASGGIMAQVTVVRGGPEAFGGASFTSGVNVATIGWFDAGLFDIPLGAHVIFDPQRRSIGFTTEMGISAGVPGYSLVEAFGQAVWTETTIDTAAQGMVRSYGATDPSGDTRRRYIADAVARGASPEEAATFVDRLIQ